MKKKTRPQKEKNKPDLKYYLLFSIPRSFMIFMITKHKKTQEHRSKFHIIHIFDISRG